MNVVSFCLVGSEINVIKVFISFSLSLMQVGVLIQFFCFRNEVINFLIRQSNYIIVRLFTEKLNYPL